MFTVSEWKLSIAFEHSLTKDAVKHFPNLLYVVVNKVDNSCIRFDNGEAREFLFTLSPK